MKKWNSLKQLWKMDNEKYSERICRIIWHDALQQSIKPFSWGIDFSSIKVIDKGTEFKFQTQTVMGKIRIRYSEGTGLFNVTVIHVNDERNPVIIENVYIDMLVSVIDENVEYCKNYQKRIYREYELAEKSVAV